MPPRETLLLIDGHAAAYRAFYAIRNLTGPDGTPTNAIFGFVKAFQRARELIKPSHLAVAWDGGLDEQRTDILPGYKSERDPMPDDLEPQLDAIVTGCVAVTRAGHRAGKGEGYSDIEYAILRELGHAEIPVATTGHSIRVPSANSSPLVLRRAASFQTP